MTGKKVTLVAHSLGNLAMYNQIMKLDKETKDKYIKTWVSIAPPFLGSKMVQKNLLLGDADLMFL